jgi:hypothetical protein
MLWARMLAYITGTVDQELLLLRNFFCPMLYQSLTETKFLTVLTRTSRVRYF